MEESFKYFERHFLNMYPLKLMSDVDGMIRKCSLSGTDWQKKLIDITARHPLNVKYGIDPKYQQAFLKLIISRLESEGTEVSDELYEVFCTLLTLQEHDTIFKHYILDNNSSTCISLIESKNMISQGTTGLCSWQAAQVLADWCLSHTDELHGKRVLELGSGVGLTGITAVLCCNLLSYSFSDCHPAVLDTLCKNVHLNLSIQAHNSCCSHTESKSKALENIDMHDVLRINHKDTNITVMNLPWAEITQDIVPDLDFVLAADVVYDKSLFTDLCQALKNLLHHKRTVAVIACTVRDRNTLQEFLSMFAQLDMKITQEAVTTTSNFLLPPGTLVNIYRIQRY